MDILELKPAERIIEILHPKTEEPIGIRVSLVSIDDERLKKIKRNFLNERMRLEQRGKHFTADDIEDNRLIITFGAMTGWEWYKDDLTLNGEKKPAFNQKNVYDVLKNCHFFSSQIEKEVEDEKAFFQT
jgi:hypothetical protein